jgi:hypothetical protein
MSCRNGGGMTNKRIPITKDMIPALYEKYGSLKAISRAKRITYDVVRRRYVEAVVAKLMDEIPMGAKSRDHTTLHIKGALVAKKAQASGTHKDLENPSLPLKKGKVTRFIFTSAQNNTKINEAVFNNLLVLKDYYDAELHISYFSYDKNSLGARGDKAKWLLDPSQVYIGKVAMWFDTRLEPHASNYPRRIANGFIWCGEQNISPTAARPLSGMESLGGRDSTVIPHAKTQMKSVESSREEATKFVYTTGTVTQRNYIMRKEGRKASFHHSYGALVVEVDARGSWWARQIVADESGTFYDVDPAGDKCLRVKAGIVTTGHGPEAVVWGDVHVAQIDKVVARLAWGKGGMLDTLRPRMQFFHDLFDMHARGHHDIDDKFAMFERHVSGEESVRAEVEQASMFVDAATRDWCKSIVVNSNHDRALYRWIKESKLKQDPVNFEFHTLLTALCISAIKGKKRFIALREAYLAITGQNSVPEGLQFLHEDESFIICNGSGNGIEMGMHGDRGPNGSRGSREAFTKMGRKCVIGHSHSAGITDGVYQTGTCSILDPEYAKGPSSWSHSHVIVYPNGKRAVITMWKGKWRA